MSTKPGNLNAVSPNQPACYRILSLLWTVLMAIMFASAVPAAEEREPDACGKNETMTDEGCAKNPRIVHKTEPEYPKEARKHRVAGSVTLQARVTEDGTVDEITVTNGQATDVSFIPSFRDSAVSALSKWRYRTATIKGKPVAFYFTVTMDFML